MFAAGDWTCSGCGNTNWARRNTCNMCNTPKPGTVDVNREGTAGGFKVRYTSTAGLGKLEWAINLWHTQAVMYVTCSATMACCRQPVLQNDGAQPRQHADLRIQGALVHVGAG